MKAAFDKFDITPAEPVYMAGYSRKSKSTGVLDPIEINSLALEIEGTTIVFSIFDSIIIEEAFVMRVKKEVNRRLNIPVDNIIIGCIHTHSAPAFFKLPFEATKVEGELTKKTEQDLVESITRAYSNMKEVTIKFEKAMIDGLYGNRNLKDGYADKAISLINFYNEQNSLEGSFVNISVHPTILNSDNMLLSADLIGFLRKKLQADLNAPVLITNGTCGDVSTRFYRKLSGLDELQYVSSSIAEQLKAKAAAKALTLSNPKIAVVEVTSVFDASVDDFNNSKLRELYKLMENSDEEKAHYLRFLASRLEFKKEASPMELHLTSTIIKTDDLMLITLPGDVNSYFGRLIKESFKDKEVIVVGYANSYVSYMVEKESYGKYFETFNSRLHMGAADEFISKVISKAKAL